MNLAVLPDGRVLHTTRTGEIRIHNPRTGLNTLAGDARRLPARRGRPAERRDRPELRDQRWVYVYYSPPLNTPVDDPIDAGAPTRATRPRPARRRHFAPFKGHLQLSRFKLQGRQARPRRPSRRSSGAGRSRDLLPRRRQHRLRRRRQPVPVDGRRLEPVRVGRLRADRRLAEPQPGLRRAPQRGQHERPARQDPAHPRPKDGGGYTIPQGNLFRQGTAQDQARDLRDGPAQPVPLRGQPHQRRRLPRRLLAGRRRGEPAARARRARAAG